MKKYIKLKKKDSSKEFREYKKSFLYSYGLLIPLLFILGLGFSQALYNLNTYEYCRSKQEQFKDFTNIQKSTFSLGFSVIHNKYLIERNILDKSGFSIQFDSYRSETINSFPKTIEGTIIKRNYYTKEFMDYIYLKKKISEENKAFDLLFKSPCLSVTKKKEFQSQYLSKIIPQELCEKLAEKLSNSTFVKSFMWVTHQETLLRKKFNESLKTNSTLNIANLYKTKAYLDYDLYIRYVFEPYLREYKRVYESDLQDFSQRVNTLVENLTLYGVIVSTILTFVVYYFYQRKSKILIGECIYIVKLIPMQTLIQNTYVKSRLVKILRLNRY